uniref:NADH-ubiquinone oxidoreductase chain 5 n=1 Tax=Neotrigonia margaritacea TaxID=47539 RepID=A0A1X9JQ50_9BIVA|nr:NADH dehydrogenase subunit 5 [Neotrigonia margaritacea]AQT38491.1 NADH dehydrogenase subunit 5 [Neotrigonia margaritacea]
MRNTFIGSPLFSCMFLYFSSFILFVWGVCSLEGFGAIMVEWEFLSFTSMMWSVPILFDSVSLIFSSLVCLIAGSVSFFSIYYMDSEVFLRRFMSLILLFVASMNLLIFIPSMVSFLVGWDGLGIVSFALVIYYQNKKSLAGGMLTALANRVGDALLIVCICLMVNWGDWSMVFGNYGMFGVSICCLLVGGAMTKSAQIPFSAWLPAAMAAPTPVSALVHSSTLVTAGVYLVVRFYPTLLEFPGVLSALGKIGGLTLLMAGLSACFEKDLKKVIALSTLSQLGLMMYSVGVGCPMITVFHLCTHALFKALLFLCAGSVIHSTVDTQDVRLLGAIRGILPVSSGCLILSSMALCGMPFLSGFYSKDLVLESCLGSNQGVVEVVVVFLGAGLSLFYSFRLVLMAIFGPSASNPMLSFSVESLPVIIPMTVLSTGGIFGGWFLQSLWVDISSLILLSAVSKFSLIFVTFLGFMVPVVFKAGLRSYWISNVSKLEFYCSSMWFLGLLSGGPVSGYGLLTSTKMFVGLDLGWMEVLGGQGAFESLKHLMEFNLVLQKNSIIVLLRLSLVFLLPLSFLYMLL